MRPEKATSPADLVRAAQCRELEAEYPCWNVTWNLYGFTGTLRSDPAVKVQGESMPGFRALMDARGAYLDQVSGITDDSEDGPEAANV